MILAFNLTILSISFAVFAILFEMLLPHKLPEKLQKQVMKCGLVHFTFHDRAKNIVKTGVITASNCFNCTYFFQPEAVFQDFIVQNHLENKDAVIHISSLTAEQVKRLRIRYYDLTLVCYGDFRFSEHNNVSIDHSFNSIPCCSHMNFHFKISRWLFAIGVACLIGFCIMQVFVIIAIV